MSADYILLGQYKEHRPSDYKKSTLSLSCNWYPLVRSLTFFMVNYFPLIAINFYIMTRFGILNLNYVLFC